MGIIKSTFCGGRVDERRLWWGRVAAAAWLLSVAFSLFSHINIRHVIIDKLPREPFRWLKSHYDDKAKQIGTCKTTPLPSPQKKPRLKWHSAWFCAFYFFYGTGCVSLMCAMRCQRKQTQLKTELIRLIFLRGVLPIMAIIWGPQCDSKNT